MSGPIHVFQYYNIVRPVPRLEYKQRDYSQLTDYVSNLSPTPRLPRDTVTGTHSQKYANSIRLLLPEV